MFDQGHFKFKVIVQGQTHCHVSSISFEPLVGFTKKIHINDKYDESICSVYVCKGRFNVKVIVQCKTMYDLGPLPSSITLTTFLTN